MRCMHFQHLGRILGKGERTPALFEAKAGLNGPLTDGPLCGIPTITGLDRLALRWTRGAGLAATAGIRTPVLLSGRLRHGTVPGEVGIGRAHLKLMATVPGVGSSAAGKGPKGPAIAFRHGHRSEEEFRHHQGVNALAEQQPQEA